MQLEYCPGGTLAEYLQTHGQLDYSQVLNFGLQITQGLNYMHNFNQRGLVHRDLKPHNILFDETQRILKITDFGLSLVTGRSAGTISGVKGTPEYMAPEQWQAGEVTEKCDIYAWAMIMWQCLTGKKPWAEAKGHFEILSSVTGDQRPAIPD